MATATALVAEGNRRAIASSTDATLHVSKISPTKDVHLGVVRAQCGMCKTELERKGKNLYCPKCRRSQPRKLADDYGDVKI